MSSELNNPQQLSLNRMQLTSVLHHSKRERTVTGRGTGKSTGKAWRYHKLVQTMPGGTAAIVGATYTQMLGKTLIPTLEGMSKIGYHRDVHWVIGKEPPAHFKRAYQEPLEWDRFLSFHTGFGFHLTSQDREGKARGLNIDYWDADEGLLLDKTKLENEVMAANRGNREYFGKNPLHHGNSISSSMPINAKGNWLLAEGDYYAEDGNDIWLPWNNICKLQYELVETHNYTQRCELIADIAELKRKLRFYPSKDGVLFTLYNAFDNIQNLGWEYIKEMYRTMTKTAFLIEIINMRLTGVENGFYNLNPDVHFYSSYNYGYIDGLEFNFEKLKESNCLKDGDVIRGKPLDLEIDWGAAINCLWVSQEVDDGKEYRKLKAMHVKWPLGLKDLINNFCDYYAPHNKKTVWLWYDHTAIGRDAVRGALVNEAVKYLKLHGWTVVLKYIGKTPDPINRFTLWEILLKGEDPRFPRIRFNRDNCKYGLLSMQLAGIKQGDKGFKKDKDSERSSTIPREQATDYSDAVDIGVWGRYAARMDRKRVFVDTKTA